MKIHHSHAESQYTAIASAETLVPERIAVSIGSVGDAYDTALAQTTIGLFKTEAIGPGSPFRPGPLRTLDDVLYPNMERLDWYDNRRLLSVSHPPNTRNAHYGQLWGDVSNVKSHQTTDGSTGQ